MKRTIKKKFTSPKKTLSEKVKKLNLLVGRLERKINELRISLNERITAEVSRLDKDDEILNLRVTDLEQDNDERDEFEINKSIASMDAHV